MGELVKFPSSKCDCVSCTAWRMSNVNPREAMPQRDYLYIWQILGWYMIVVGIIGLLLFAWAKSAHAFDHHWNPNSPVAEWYRNLKVPNQNPRTSSCCDKGDAYRIEILQEPLDDTNRQGEAVVTDGEEIHFDDGTIRARIDVGTHFKFPKSLMNPPSDGNPTTSAVLFATAYEGKITNIYCVVPLLPGS